MNTLAINRITMLSFFSTLVRGGTGIPYFKRKNKFVLEDFILFSPSNTTTKSIINSQQKLNLDLQSKTKSNICLKLKITFLQFKNSLVSFSVNFGSIFFKLWKPKRSSDFRDHINKQNGSLFKYSLFIFLLKCT